MLAKHPKISVCVLTFNRCNVLRHLLRELTTLAYSPLELIVVDNCSEDGTREMIVHDFSQINYLRTERNLGAVGRNVGMQAATGEIVVTLDDDIDDLGDADLLEIVSLFNDRPDLGCVNFKVNTVDGNICNWVHHCRVEDYHDKEFPTYEITEGAVAFRKQCLDSAGYYAANFFLSHEGPDLAFRILEAGYEVLYSGKIAVKHHFAEASREPWRNYYYDTRNQFWLAARNFPVAYAAKYLARGLSAMLYYSLRDGFVRYWFKAVFDAFCGLPRVLRERRVLSAGTVAKLRRVDSNRPGLLYMIRKRLFGDIALRG